MYLKFLFPYLHLKILSLHAEVKGEDWGELEAEPFCLKQGWEAGRSSPVLKSLPVICTRDWRNGLKQQFNNLAQISYLGELGHRETWKKWGAEQTYFDMWAGAGGRGT